MQGGRVIKHKLHVHPSTSANLPGTMSSFLVPRGREEGWHLEARVSQKS